MHIRTNVEVLNGVWDSLATNRAYIVIGADMDIPETIGAVSTLDLGNSDMGLKLVGRAAKKR